MTFRQSTAVINACLNAIPATIGASAVLDIYSGPPPASCVAVATGTKLASLPLPSTYFAAASAAAMALTGTWQAAVAVSGYAGYGRLLDTTDTTVGLQFCISENWLASKTYGLGQQAANGGSCYRITTPGTSAPSAGPTGTGSAITDGTCVWAYVEPADFIVDNSNLSAGQILSASAFTISGTANL